MNKEENPIPDVFKIPGLTVNFESMPQNDKLLVVILDGIIDTSNSIIFQNKICELMEKGFIYFKFGREIISVRRDKPFFRYL
jgi:hypothetical protein